MAPRFQRSTTSPPLPTRGYLADGRITEEQKNSRRETFARLDPIFLLNRIREAQQRIAGIEVHGGPVEPVDLNQNLGNFVSNLGSAWKAGEVRSTHRKPNVTTPLAHSRRSFRDDLAAHRKLVERTARRQCKGTVSTFASQRPWGPAWATSNPAAAREDLAHRDRAAPCPRL
jgi:hypothetical protein